MRYGQSAERDGSRSPYANEASASPRNRGSARVRREDPDASPVYNQGRREPSAGRIYIGSLPVRKRFAKEESDGEKLFSSEDFLRPINGLSAIVVGVCAIQNNADKPLIEELFGKFGRIAEISIKRTISGSPFAFVEFEDPRDAQDAIQERDGFKIDGCMLRVEVPFAARSGARNQYNRGPPRRADYRVFVTGLPPSGSWQDLKDHMREAGDCVYADVYRDGTGVVEFSRRGDMEYAIRHFNKSTFRSHEGETSRLTVTAMDEEESKYRRYDSRQSPDNRRYRGRSPYYEGRDYHHRGGHGDYGRSPAEDYSEGRRPRSHSDGRNQRSASRTRSRSRSYQRHR